MSETRWYHDGCGGEVIVMAVCDERYVTTSYAGWCRKCEKYVDHLGHASSSRKEALAIENPGLK